MDYGGAGRRYGGAGKNSPILEHGSVVKV